MSRLVLVLSVLAAASIGCDALATSDEVPSPSPTPEVSPSPEPAVDPAALDVGIVLAPPDAGSSAAQGEAVRAAADAVEGGGDPDVRRIRVVDAPNEDLRRDALEYLVVDGADVVCTVGPSGDQHLLDLADRYPRTRFCLLDGELGEERDNTFAIDLPDAEAAFLAGAAAALAAGAEAVGVLTSVADPLPDESADALHAGVRHVRGVPDPSDDDSDDRDADDEGPEDEDIADEDEPDEPAEVEVITAAAGATPEEDRAVVAGTVLAALRDGPLAVVVVYGTPAAIAGAVDAARTAGGQVVGGSADVVAVSGEEAAERTPVSVAKRFDVALHLALRWAAAPDEAVDPLELGDALTVVAGGSEAAEEVAAEVEAVLDGLVDGRVDVTHRP